ncbi:Prephenate dehydrogenase, partial [human gut metagenome]
HEDAASDPRLWSAILVGNAGPVVGLLRALREDLDTLIGGIAPAAVDPASPDYPAAGRAQTIAPGAVGAITDVMGRGNTGQARIPGKHG